MLPRTAWSREESTLSFSKRFVGARLLGRNHEPVLALPHGPYPRVVERNSFRFFPADRISRSNGTNGTEKRNEFRSTKKKIRRRSPVGAQPWANLGGCALRKWPPATRPVLAHQLASAYVFLLRNSWSWLALCWKACRSESWQIFQRFQIGEAGVFAIGRPRESQRNGLRSGLEIILMKRASWSRRHPPGNPPRRSIARATSASHASLRVVWGLVSSP
jgi:hypothetical protein